MKALSVWTLPRGPAGKEEKVIKAKGMGCRELGSFMSQICSLSPRTLRGGRGRAFLHRKGGCLCFLVSKVTTGPCWAPALRCSCCAQPSLSADLDLTPAAVCSPLGGGEMGRPRPVSERALGFDRDTLPPSAFPGGAALSLPGGPCQPRRCSKAQAPGAAGARQRRGREVQATRFPGSRTAAAGNSGAQPGASRCASPGPRQGRPPASAFPGARRAPGPAVPRGRASPRSPPRPAGPATPPPGPEPQPRRRPERRAEPPPPRSPRGARSRHRPGPAPGGLLPRVRPSQTKGGAAGRVTVEPDGELAAPTVVLHADGAARLLRA